MTKKFKEVDKFSEPDVGRMSRCGHYSPKGRYFKCENCLANLPEDNGDWNYCDMGDED